MRRLVADPHLDVSIFETDDGQFVCRVSGIGCGTRLTRHECPIGRDLLDCRDTVADLVARAMDALLMACRARSADALKLSELGTTPNPMKREADVNVAPSSEQMATIINRIKPR